MQSAETPNSQKQVDAAKRAAARAAIEFIHPQCVLGVGSGSTVALFVEELGKSEMRPAKAVSTSEETDRLLQAIDVMVVSLDDTDEPIEIYVDGADEVDAQGRAIKGGGGAHTREKLVALASRSWVCIVDESKAVSDLGSHTDVPVEVEHGQLESVMGVLADWGAVPHVRREWSSDPLHLLIDVAGLDMSDPSATESRLEALPGVVACGIFAHRRADVVLVGHADGRVVRIVPEQKIPDSMPPCRTD